MSPVDEIRKTLSQAKETRLKILELCDSIYKQVSRTGNPQRECRLVTAEGSIPRRRGFLGQDFLWG